MMRQPLEKGIVTIARAAGTFTYPVRFMLMASMSPWPCGYRGTRSDECRCDGAAIAKYLSTLSGPLLDRVDQQIEVIRVALGDMLLSEPDRSSKIRERVAAARERQQKRFAGMSISCNAEIPGSAIKTYRALDGDAMKLLVHASRVVNFSHERLTVLHARHEPLRIWGAATALPANTSPKRFSTEASNGWTRAPR